MTPKEEYLVTEKITIENARILFRNFEGRQTTFNSLGNRNFCVVLDPELADRLSKDGWNVKTLTSATEMPDGSNEVTFFMQVKLGYPKDRPGKGPQIWIISEVRNPRMLTEDTVNILDWADITSVDLIINPYNWRRKSTGEIGGVKAYLAKMYVTLREDALDRKYANEFDRVVHQDDDAEAE